MSDMSSSIAAIQEFFVAQDRSRAELADTMCAAFLDALAALQGKLGERMDADLVILAELWPLLELRDAMLLATREMVNINGESTICLRKRAVTRSNPYASNVTLIPIDALENATRQIHRLAAKVQNTQ